jgi:hypothetical protein
MSFFILRNEVKQRKVAIGFVMPQISVTFGSLIFDEDVSIEHQPPHPSKNMNYWFIILAVTSQSTVTSRAPVSAESSK